MNIATNDHAVDDYNEDLIFRIAEALGDIAGINIDDNCSIGELSNLLTEIETECLGDTSSAVAAICAGGLQFEEIQCHDATNDWWEWHIKATRQ
jgi:hypothetical protein